MKKIINKIKNRLEIKRAFKVASFVLDNGKYLIKGKTFTLLSNNQKEKGFAVKVKSNRKFETKINKGIVNITPYKILLMNDSVVFSFIRTKERYYNIKNNAINLINKLPYKTMDADFFDEDCLVVSNVIKGIQVDDEEHLWKFIYHYFDSIKLDYIESNEMDMNKNIAVVLFYPQHGDCHPWNIFWNEDEPVLIDLDDIDSYPLFYDIFYYIIAAKHEDAFSFFRASSFRSIFERFCVTNKLNNEEDNIDYYLSAYIYYWVNKMTLKMNFHEINFYMQWFINTDLSSFPLVEKAINQYKINLNKLRIKNEKR